MDNSKPVNTLVETSMKLSKKGARCKGGSHIFQEYDRKSPLFDSDKA